MRSVWDNRVCSSNHSLGWLYVIYAIWLTSVPSNVRQWIGVRFQPCKVLSDWLASKQQLTNWYYLMLCMHRQGINLVENSTVIYFCLSLFPTVFKHKVTCVVYGESTVNQTRTGDCDLINLGGGGAVYCLSLLLLFLLVFSPYDTFDVD